MNRKTFFLYLNCSNSPCERISLPMLWCPWGNPATFRFVIIQNTL